ncbi:MAG TPA: methylmalonyl Co-A mutase-associated GTPase MeaB [Acidimicrobiales bacterium]|jgi:LAO/AO transport system kinase|nr:methylmalonyl Co-A mutase-associated GTPase MeaB [Acidimicrobiales bacterium]
MARLPEADAAAVPGGRARPGRSAEELVAASRSGDRAATARLISLIERGGEPAREVAGLTFPHAADAYTVGITGAPGAGKSTLTDRLIAEQRRRGRAIGVLAVDPSSPFSGGALLGDRVRMQDHTLDDGVFIRSMATRGHLGGLALATPEAIRVLAAAGLGLVLVETVGVGQVEVEVAGATDTTLVVVNPGWGDAIQANKAGLLEVADVFVVNKADRPGAEETRRDLDHMLDLGPARAPGDWRPPILPAVATTGSGVPEVWAAVEEHRRFLTDSGQLAARRERRLVTELRQVLIRRLEQDIDRLEGGHAYRQIRQQVLDRSLDPYRAAETLLAQLSATTGK